MTIKIHRYLIAFIFSAINFSAIAQDDLSDAEAVLKQQEAQQSVNEKRNDNTDIGNTGPDNQVFIPSEEISEDAPVAFPVDI